MPEASLTAVTVTPGSTPPVLSFTVPLSVASCAYDANGKATNATINQINRPNFITASLELSHVRRRCADPRYQKLPPVVVDENGSDYIRPVNNRRTPLRRRL